MPRILTQHSQSDDSQWDEFVDNHPLGSIYHLSSWRHAIERSFKHIKGVTVVIQEDKTGKILAGLPVYLVKSWLTGKRLVSAPFAMACDPLVTTPAEYEKIHTCLLGLYNEFKADYIEIRTSGLSDLQNTTEFRLNNGYQTHDLFLKDDLEDLFRSFHKKSIRVLISKAQKAGFTIRTAHEQKDLDQFYQMMVLSRCRLGLPPIPYVFFESLMHYFAPRGLLTFLLVFHQNMPAGGQLLLSYKDTLIAEYACDNPKYRKMGINQLMDWDSINIAQKKGLKKYNYGRTANSNESLITYKNRWGTKVSSLPILYFPPHLNSWKKNKESSKQYQIARQLFLKTPPQILVVLGKLLYRHMG